MTLVWFMLLLPIFFMSMKFVAWANVFLVAGAIGKSLGPGFWKITPVEFALGLASSITFAWMVLLEDDRFFIPLICTITSSVLIALHTLRAWQLLREDCLDEGGNHSI